MKKAENIQLYMLLVLFVGLGICIVYGILKNDRIIIILNSFSFIIHVILTDLIMKCKKDK
jgi:uncharacterized protein with PQ loop repeat